MSCVVIYCLEKDTTEIEGSNSVLHRSGLLEGGHGSSSFVFEGSMLIKGGQETSD